MIKLHSNVHLLERLHMAKSKVSTYPYLEKWATRYGTSERVVIRDENGKFVDNVSLTALRKAPSLKR
jgi:hypothetical protein